MNWVFYSLGAVLKGRLLFRGGRTLDHTSLNQIIVDVMMVFMVLGALDFCLGGRFGLGAQFERGLQTMGPLALSMVKEAAGR